MNILIDTALDARITVPGSAEEAWAKRWLADRSWAFGDQRRHGLREDFQLPVGSKDYSIADDYAILNRALESIQTPSGEPLHLNVLSFPEDAP